ncbi:DNA primase [Desulfitobacterium dichloroeliminans LMG P-21439]|uniref:DNA primase n=1 Tax=Desulfitobacterium dichloroeliminans (strain LMG P-21439 / DCA1) TaxID=871963 RepID=L0FCF8_DESDL|nr:DNA primase [Desulfitobacterium dichloroeliminans]AGA70341.1 DNA primase [Desulfitobacterium dichloroeliminans LMG P-21439]
MDYRIPEEIVEEVRLHSDIVDTISDYVRLQRKGKNYLGLCPFHAEKTPSFTVTPEKQIFYCFGCHTGGNVFSFLMRKENWSFLETVENLAEKHGIILPEKELSPREKEQQTRRRRWEEIHDWATGYFHEVLLHKPEGEPGRQYFRQRGIDDETIKQFRLGYAPERWEDLLEALSARGVSPQEVVQAGLALEREPSEGRSRGFYDRFRNRVIFAILDSRQRTIGFGGRVLDNSTPKYLNSPETAFFNKGHHLYGMHRAHQGIRERGFALLAEGYMDVIALQKAGFKNAVASLGTALTRDQAKLIRRYTGRVVIVYDSDQAGIQATLRAGEIVRDMGFRVDVLSLSGAKDPDEYLKTFGVEEFNKALAQAEPYIQFKYHVLIKTNPPGSAPEKAELVRELAPDIVKVQSPVEREGYERFLSLELSLTLDKVQEEIAGFDQKTAKKTADKENLRQKQDIYVKNRDNINRCANPSSDEVSVSDGVYRAERFLLRLLLEQLIPLSKFKADLEAGFWKVPYHQQIYTHIEKAPKLDNGALPHMDSDALLSKVAELMLEEIDLSHPERLFQDCLKQIHSLKEEETVEELQARMVDLEKSGDLAGAFALLKEIGERLRSGEN